MKGKFSVVIPVYNEAERIEKNLEEVKRTFDEFGCSYEIIVVDVGKGRALKKAFKYTKGDWIVWLDADLDLHPFQIKTLYDILILSEADVVIGSKFHPNSQVKYPLHRKIISLGDYSLIRFLFALPCRDTQTGIKLFKREVLEKVFPRILVKKFAFDLEVLVNAHHLGFKISEAPVYLNSQRKFSRIKLRDILNTFWDTLAVWYRMYILKYYTKIDYYRSKNLKTYLKYSRKFVAKK